MSLSRKDDVVTLAMTPQRAQLLAASIWLGEANHRGWLDDLSTAMEAAAGGAGVFRQDGTSAEVDDVELDLPLPRDRAPDVHDPLLDTLHSPEALSVASSPPANVSVADALRAMTAQAAEEAMLAVSVAAPPRLGLLMARRSCVPWRRPTRPPQWRSW